MRGTFANIRLRNQLAPGTEGGWTTYQPDGEVMTIYDAAMRYKDAGVPLRRPRRQGVRLGLVARLGGEGHAAARRARGHRRELRAHPPQQPGRTWACCRCSSRPARPRRRSGSPARELFEIAGIADGPDAGRTRSRCARAGDADDRVPGHRAHRHAGGARRVPARRHPAVRAAAAGRQALSAEVTQGRRYVSRDSRARGLRACVSPIVTMPDVRRRSRRRARELGFDACGIAPAADLPELRFFSRVDRARLRRLDGVSRRDRPSAAPMSASVLPSAQHGDRHRHRLQHRPALLDRVRRSATARRSRATRGATTTTT